ncbi:MAG: zinc ribbon domain-containing protein [Selenomonadaceae bacterium]|nr:zinc ribbon domain-containing protein [Selenomonadaceae bacterium]
MALLSIVFSVLCAYLVKRDAEKRGLSAGPMFFGTIATLFIPIMGVAYFFFGRPKNLPKRFDAADTVDNVYRRQGSREVTVNEQSFCPNCGKSVPASFTFCPHCRVQLKADN